MGMDMIGDRPTGGLSENDVVDAVCKYLETTGFSIKQRLMTTQTGDDIVAERGGELLYVEAKGATSARAGSARFGRAFDSAQIHVHVAEAVFRALQILSRAADGRKVHAAIALPASAIHQRKVESVSKTLGDLGITIFWVTAAREVRMHCASE
jgi:hypothetical protein